MPARRPARRAAATAADLLLEIGAEELPAAYLDAAIEQLGRDAEALLRDAHVEFASIESYGTPRRLTLIVRQVNPVQRKPAEEIRGPSKQAGFDAKGQPTEALKGFLRSRGGTLKDVKVVSTDKGDYCYVVKASEQTPTGKILPSLVQQLIARLRFPKTMRWDESGVRFARPVQWLIVLYGATPIRVTCGRLTSGRITQVGGPKHPKAVRVTDAGQYLTVMKREGILLNPTERRAKIQALVTDAAERASGVPVPDMVLHGLVDEVTGLVERPVKLVGAFDQKYLNLPREVLLASMAKHQRVFAVKRSTGDEQLLPAFVAILDGAPNRGALERVRKFHAHILNARLADSLLFWEQDRRVPLAKHAERLSQVTFHERLGSMADKATRLQALVKVLANEWQLEPETTERTIRAAQLAKADLVTTMVKEFPTLQGVMGKYYAEGEHKDVCEAIERHYWLMEESEMERHLHPERIPGDDVSMALAIADKYDTLASYFGIGIEPTGSEDPFALRQRAQAIVLIASLRGFKRPVSLERLFQVRAIFPPFDSMSEKDKNHVALRIGHYIRERLSSLWEEHDAPSRELIAAMCASFSDDLADLIERTRQLHQFEGNSSANPALVKAAKVIERTRNILKSVTIKQTDVDPGRFQEADERTLWELYTAHKDRILGLIGKRAYGKATIAYGDVFFDPLNQFFDHVMVNVNDEAVQQNRLALLRAISALYTDRVADLSKLTLNQPAAAANQPASLGRSA